ncbi:hypothetical protein GCM10027341_36780 [Spirosoma knui]
MLPLVWPELLLVPYVPEVLPVPMPDELEPLVPYVPEPVPVVPEPVLLVPVVPWVPYVEPWVPEPVVPLCVPYVLEPVVPVVPDPILVLPVVPLCVVPEFVVVPELVVVPEFVVCAWALNAVAATNNAPTITFFIVELLSKVEISCLRFVVKNSE